MSLVQRLKMRLSGYVYVGEKNKDGWRGSLPHYIFECPTHGVVESYPHGYEGRLECPRCIEEKVKA